MNLNALAHSYELMSSLSTDKYSIDMWEIASALKGKSFIPAARHSLQTPPNVCVAFCVQEKKS